MSCLALLRLVDFWGLYWDCVGVRDSPNVKRKNAVKTLLGTMYSQRREVCTLGHEGQLQDIVRIIVSKGYATGMQVPPLLNIPRYHTFNPKPLDPEV